MMAPRLFIRRPARTDLMQAFEWYERQSRGLGYEFLRAARVTLAAIERNPAQYPVALDDIRKAPLRRFPYVVYYVETPRGWSVIAVQHGKRNPSRWQARR